jgi:hypothetical protein
MNRADAEKRSGRSQRTIIRWITSGRLRTTRVATNRYPYWRHDISIEDLVEAIDADLRTHCRNGHEYTPDNTSLWGPDSMWRRCLDCDRERNKKYYDRDRVSA